MKDSTKEKVLTIIAKMVDKDWKSPTPEPKPRRVSQTYDPKNYKGLTWNKNRKAYDYNLD